jgi:hypothetical protein
MQDKQTPRLLVCKQTMQTVRPPLVGELSANFRGERGVTWSEQQVPTAINLGFLN